MKHINLSPREYTQDRKTADEYDQQQLIALQAERQRVLEGKSLLGRAATRFAAQFYRGELGTNMWQTNRHTNAMRTRRDFAQD